MIRSFQVLNLLCSTVQFLNSDKQLAKRAINQQWNLNRTVKLQITLISGTDTRSIERLPVTEATNMILSLIRDPTEPTTPYSK